MSKLKIFRLIMVFAWAYIGIKHYINHKTFEDGFWVGASLLFGLDHLGDILNDK